MKELDFAFIGQWIKDIRAEKYTQEYLANVTGINFSHISSIETSKAKVSLTPLVHACNCLDTTMNILLGNEYSAPSTATNMHSPKFSRFCFSSASTPVKLMVGLSLVNSLIRAVLPTYVSPYIAANS